MEKTEKLKNNNFVLAILKGSLIAVASSLIGILFFAFIIKLFGITDQFLRPVNQVIKGISILLGVFISAKKYKQNGLILGAVVGLVYTLLAFVVFSALNGSFNIDKTLLNDVLFGGIMGAICGIIAVNVNKKAKN
ncbi:MAG TPA: TIGR04086 family membrane protein [Clostridiales bacterium]|nr:TIGR04086 family membrane protein [Clostridiales bacterium]